MMGQQTSVPQTEALLDLYEIFKSPGLLPMLPS
jgi:hypothetical protein